MKKLLFILVVMTLFIYIFIYRMFFIFGDEVVKYIVNPVVWILLSLICYLLYQSRKIALKHKSDIIYIVIGSSLLYIIIFFTLGLFIGYTKNPYSFTLSGIIINLFSILLVIVLKEYIRDILLIESKKYGLLYPILIFFIFVLSDINIVLLIRSFTDYRSNFNTIGELVIPVIAINVWMHYLCYRGGFIPAVLYRTIILLPSLVVPILPKYEWIIPVLFDILFPLFTYLVIEYMLNKRNKMVPKEVTKQSNPSSWVVTFIVTILIIMYGLGAFSTKPSVIITASMKPNINPGDVVIVENIAINDIRAGDIIQYKMNNYSIVHRVVNVLNDGNSIYLITKGDNNNKPDRKPVSEDQIIGKVKFHIPLLGYPSYLLQKIIGRDSVEIETGK